MGCIFGVVGTWTFEKSPLQKSCISLAMAYFAKTFQIDSCIIERGHALKEGDTNPVSQRPERERHGGRRGLCCKAFT